MSTELGLSVEGPSAFPLARATLLGLDADKLPVQHASVTVTLHSGTSLSVDAGDNAEDPIGEIREGLSAFDREKVSTLTLTLVVDDHFDITVAEPDDTPLATVERVNDSRSDSSVPPDVPGRIKKDTLDHLALWIGHHIAPGSNEWFVPEEIADACGGILSINRAEGALSRLYRRKALLNRQDYDGPSNRWFEYGVNESGIAELDRLGTPDPRNVAASIRKKSPQDSGNLPEWDISPSELEESAG